MKQNTQSGVDIKYILTLRNNGIVSDLAPMPCSDEDSKDIAYIRKIFNFIESNPDKFDATRVYAEGFSQNSMFSAHIGHCFQDRVLDRGEEARGVRGSGGPTSWPSKANVSTY